MKFTSSFCSSFVCKDLHWQYVSVSRFRASRDAALKYFSTVSCRAHKINWFNQSLQTEYTTNGIRSLWHHSLLQRNGIVSRTNLGIQYIKITPLLALDGISFLVECTQLQSYLTVKHVHTNFEIQTRGDVQSQVVGLEN